MRNDKSPFNSYGGEELYPSIQAKTARLCYGLVKNHAMIDGNKRIGAHAMLTFLLINGYELSYTQKELSDLILDVAAGKSAYEDILQCGRSTANLAGYGTHGVLSNFRLKHDFRFLHTFRSANNSSRSV